MDQKTHKLFAECIDYIRRDYKRARAYYEADWGAFDVALDAIQQSQKFVLPQNGEVARPVGRMLQYPINLPFNLTGIAYEWEHDDSDTMRELERSTGRVSINATVVLAIQREPNDVITFVQFERYAEKSHWYMMPFSCRIQNGSDASEVNARAAHMESLSTLCEHANVSMPDKVTTLRSADGAPFVFAPIPLLRHQLRGMIDRCAREERLDMPAAAQRVHGQACLDLASGARAVLSLIETLSCVNVETHKVTVPHSGARAALGRATHTDYHVLVIDSHRIDRPQRDNDAPHGTHASPRQHFRRGHIRRLQSGRNTYVRATLVGAGPGFVHKDYKLK